MSLARKILFAGSASIEGRSYLLFMPIAQEILFAVPAGSDGRSSLLSLLQQFWKYYVHLEFSDVNFA